MDKEELEKRLEAISKRDTRAIHRWTIKQSNKILKEVLQKEALQEEVMGKRMFEVGDYDATQRSADAIFKAIIKRSPAVNRAKLRLYLNNWVDDQLSDEQLEGAIESLEDDALDEDDSE